MDDSKKDRRVRLIADALHAMIKDPEYMAAMLDVVRPGQLPKMDDLYPKMSVEIVMDKSASKMKYRVPPVSDYPIMEYEKDEQ